MIAAQRAAAKVAQPPQGTPADPFFARLTTRHGVCLERACASCRSGIPADAPNVSSAVPRRQERPTLPGDALTISSLRSASTHGELPDLRHGGVDVNG